MKYLRHSPLLLWIGLCIGLSAIIIGALSIGGTPSTSLSSAVTSRDQATVATLRNHLSGIHVAAIPPYTALAGKGVALGQAADIAAEERMQRAGKDDSIYRGYTALAADARNLSSLDTSNALSVQTGIALVGSDTDTLALLVTGGIPNIAPMPGEGTLDPNTTEPGETVPVPEVSVVPFNPAKPADPSQPGILEGE